MEKVGVYKKFSLHATGQGPKVSKLVEKWVRKMNLKLATIELLYRSAAGSDFARPGKSAAAVAITPSTQNYFSGMRK